MRPPKSHIDLLGKQDIDANSYIFQGKSASRASTAKLELAKILDVVPRPLSAARLTEMVPLNLLLVLVVIIVSNALIRHVMEIASPTPAEFPSPLELK